MMLRLSILTLVTILAGCGEKADTPPLASKHDNIIELLQLMDMDDMINSAYDQMEGMLKGSAEQMGVTPQEQPIFDRYYQEMVVVMKETMGWKKMEPLILDLYERNFTEKEIADMLVFYRTDTGQALLAKMPAIMQESMQMSQQLMMQSLPEIQSLSEQLMVELEEYRQTSEDESEG